MRWARGQMENSELDVELLMLYIVRSIKKEKLPGEESPLSLCWPGWHAEYVPSTQHK
jgi:hypothetical protein